MRQHEKYWPAPTGPSPALNVLCPGILASHPWLIAIACLPVNRFPTNLAPNVPNNVLKSPPFCYFASFLIIWLKLFINKSDFSRDFTIFMISFISLLEVINVVLPDPNIFIRIAALMLMLLLLILMLLERF